MSDYEAKWYESYYSVIFIPPGEIPQTKGSWEDPEFLIEMIGELKGHYPPETVMMVVSSRCGQLHTDDADGWLEEWKIGIECAQIEAAYIKAGVCSQCGACSRKEAETKCRPSPLGDTGDYTCDGERLWEDEEEENSTDED